MAGTITVGELLSDATSSNKITIGSGTTLDLASGSAGTITLDAADLTGTLPAISGASLTNLPGGGKVLQVVSTLTTTATAVSGTYPGNIPHADTGLTLNITPTESDSDILVIITQVCGYTSGASQYSVGLFRDTTNLMNTGNDVGFGPAPQSDLIGGTVRTQQSINFFDTSRPSGTSAITYKTKGGPYRTGTATFQSDSFSSHITLMEISV